MEVVTRRVTKWLIRKMKRQDEEYSERKAIESSTEKTKSRKDSEGKE